MEGEQVRLIGFRASSDIGEELVDIVNVLRSLETSEDVIRDIVVNRVAGISPQRENESSQHQIRP